MRILLDTHVLLWALAEPTRLSKDARALVESQEHDVIFSAASIWEIAIKSQIGRVTFSVSPHEIVRVAVESGFVEVPVHADAAARVADLPMHHRDPFDRLLVAQAMHEPARLLTADRTLSQYSDLVLLV